MNDPDHFKMGGEVRIETSGIMDYLTGFKLRVFGGITIERNKNETSSSEKSILTLDALMSFN